ncbi:MAG: glycosyltransferase family 2 protein [Sulfolobales archaeon]|nr:glycosyltransferase family 2 protein [Sulfolobales archaeon]
MVSIIWLNYNSKGIVDRVLKSLDAVFDLDYPEDRYELIVVDNGSSDGSFETIRGFVERRSNIKKKILGLDRNLGFAGGCNAGFRARDRGAKYIVLLNNDAIPRKDSLRIFVEEMEKRPYLGGAQGVIVDPRTGFVDTAGNYVSEYLFPLAYLRGNPPNDMKRPLYISYPDGAYSIWRVDAVLKANKAERLFYDELFAYCDDIVLGLKIWDSDYKAASFPHVVAEHSRGSTLGKDRSAQILHTIKCISFLYHISRLSLVRRLMARSLPIKKGIPLLVRPPFTLTPGKIWRAWNEGKELGLRIRGSEGYIDIDKAPLVRHRNIIDKVLFLAPARYIARYKTKELEEIYRLDDR